jgi:NadR type nicotinamide-nucleotide adenylyltransferase
VTGRGVVIGKFHPFHRGHRHVVEQALETCGRVTVIVCARREQPLAGALRQEWVARVAPAAKVLLVDQDALGLADDDTEGWARVTRDLLGEAPAAVFTSEPYGDAFAAALGCEHVAVDPGRELHPVSGRQVSADPAGHLDAVPAEVRADFVRRVCVLGAESTGKTTLAQALAERLRTPWVPEYGRPFTELERPTREAVWSTADFMHIARVQGWLEEFLAGQADRVLVCDTDVFVTARFHEVYLGEPPPAALEQAARLRRYDLYVVCDVATPFRQDRTSTRREGEHRRWMHEQYLEYARGSGARCVLVGGDRDERLEQAAAAVAELLERPLDLAEVSDAALARLDAARLLGGYGLSTSTLTQPSSTTTGKEATGS